jgi:hypothetical protein
MVVIFRTEVNGPQRIMKFNNFCDDKVLLLLLLLLLVLLLLLLLLLLLPQLLLLLLLLIIIVKTKTRNVVTLRISYLGQCL